MGANVDYPSLRYLARWTFLDILTFVMEVVCISIIVLLALLNSPPNSMVDLDSISIYLEWTCVVFRLVVWTLIIVTLSQLAEVDRAFGWARFWYAIRVLLFVLFYVAEALFRNDVSGIVNAIANSPSSLSIQLFILLGVVASPLLPSLANALILQAESDVLDAYGLDRHALANRRGGLDFFSTSIGLSLYSLVTLGLIITVTRFYGISLLDTISDSDPLKALVGVAIAIVIIAAVMYLIMWVQSAVRMQRSYRVLKELTE